MRTKRFDCFGTGGLAMGWHRREAKAALSTWAVLGVLACTLAFTVPMPAAAHELAVLPPLPTAADAIVIEVQGEWPRGDVLTLVGWSRDASLLRIDARGEPPGVPRPLDPYEFLVDIGQLGPGHYRVEYFIEIPNPPPPGPPPVRPVATLEFEVAAAPIPALQVGALGLLAVLLAISALWALRRRGSHARS